MAWYLPERKARLLFGVPCLGNVARCLCAGIAYSHCSGKHGGIFKEFSSRCHIHKVCLRLVISAKISLIFFHSLLHAAAVRLILLISPQKHNYAGIENFQNHNFRSSIPCFGICHVAFMAHYAVSRRSENRCTCHDVRAFRAHARVHVSRNTRQTAVTPRRISL